MFARTASLAASALPAPGDQLSPGWIAADQATGSLYVTDSIYPGTFARSRVLRYTSTGIASSYAGGAYTSTSSGDGGPASQASFRFGGNIATDSAGDLFVPDFYSVRQVNAATGVVSRFAGTYNSCGYPTASVGALASSVNVSANAIAVDPLTGNLWISDGCSGSILAVTPAGTIVSKFVISAIPLPSYQMAFDAQGRLYWGGNAHESYKIFRMDRTGAITSVAGTDNYWSAYSGDGGPATSAQLGLVQGIAIDPVGDIFIATGSYATIRKIDTQGIITTLNPVGINSPGFQGDGGPVSNAKFRTAGILALDSEGDLYVNDGNNRIRMMAPATPGAPIDGSSTVTSTAGGTGDGASGEQDGGANPSELCAQNCDADVNTATGEYTETTDDLKIPGRGLPLDFSRTYGSLSANTNGPLGYGWTHAYNMSLRVDASSNNVIVTQENGSLLTFYPNGSGGFSSPTRELATLVTNADGSYTLTRQARARFTFNASGQLVSESDLNGYSTSLAYDASGRLSTITDPAGRTFTLGYDASNRITSLTDSASPSRQVLYGYDAAGNLSSVTDARGKVWTYTYDSAHRLLTRTDPNQHVNVTNTYDASGRLLTQTDALNRKTTWSYQPGMTVTTSPAGNVTQDYYSNGVLWKQVKGVGSAQAATTTFAYDPTTFGTTSTTDPDGHTATATYDSAGNQLTSVDALSHTTTSTYDALNDVTSVKDPNGVTTTYTYDTGGNLLSKSTPLVGSSPAQNQVWAYTYGDSAHPGDVTGITDPDSKTSTQTWDANGDLTSVTDPAGDKTSYGYDAIGRRTSMVSPRGNATGANPADYTTAYSYDAAGNKLSQTDPLGHTTSWAYDDAGNLASTTDADTHTTGYVYDAADEQTEIHRPDGTILKSSYDGDGNLASQTDGANNPTTYQYDALDRQISVTDPLNRTTSYGYDGAGNQTTVTDPLGRVTTKGYDAANRLTSISYSDGTTPNVTIGYDADGQQTSMGDGSGSSSWAWDSLRRITSYTDGHGDTVSFGWDLAGHKTQVTYPGSHVVTYGYDDAGRMSSMTDWLSHTTSFGYDPDSDQTSTTFPSATGDVDSYGFDHADRQSSSAFAQGSSTLASLSYTRDNKGLITAVNSTGLPAGDAHSYGYNSLDQITADNTDSYAYDHADNPTTLMSAGPNTFDAANELTATPAASFGYDSLGERTSTTPTGGSATSYGYDQASRLTSYTPPSGPTASYTYDGSGLRMSKTVGTTTTRFLWDPTGTLPLLISDGSTNYLYGPDDTVAEQIDAAGTPTYYHHDQLGSTRLLTDATGVANATFSYTPYGSIAGSTGTATTPFGYAGEYADAESGLQYLRARYYDPATAQFATRDPLLPQTREAYAYSSDDPTTENDPSGLMPADNNCDSASVCHGVWHTKSDVARYDRSGGAPQVTVHVSVHAGLGIDVGATCCRRVGVSVGVHVTAGVGVGASVSHGNTIEHGVHLSGGGPCIGRCRNYSTRVGGHDNWHPAGRSYTGVRVFDFGVDAGT